ncbi:carboxypeptidase-like regulatory domain-containing protein [Actinokineospora enzanensis]|uniref:carboxypeptidase-like regulatory domain-containing protein n=1 Tax=Actinokineospora enzanensis TaxID=155975 RepID=UPI00035F902E|nr:carboxypeptidase-like regulatory domain-containing protein [Actinokineospora enzanensis]
MPVGTTTDAPPTTRAVDLPDLRITAEFDKAVYDAADRVGVRITVTNAGNAPTEHLFISTSGNLEYIGRYVFEPLAPGATFATTEYAPLARLDDARLVRLTTTADGGGADADPADNTTSITAPVTVRTGNYSGTAFTDRDGDGVLDPGEQSPHAQVSMTGGSPFGSYYRTADAEGRFRFDGLRAGSYDVAVTAPGWEFDRHQVSLDDGDDVSAVIVGRRLVTEALQVRMRFTAPEYHAGDRAALEVTFTNTDTTAAVAGLHASCYTWPATDDAASWGPLAQSAPGLTVPAGATVIVRPALTVTEENYQRGFVRAECGFHYVLFGASLSAAATARVPGGVATLTGGVFGRQLEPKTRPGPPRYESLSGVKVYLRDQDGRVVARAVTAMGIFSFRDIPAGQYEFGVVGPWKLTFGGTTYQARAGENAIDYYYGHMYLVMAGPEQPDPDPPQQTGPGGAQVPGTVPSAHRTAEPVHQATQRVPAAAGALAQTGADVAWLATSGLVTLALGAALVLWRRPRRR